MLSVATAEVTAMTSPARASALARLSLVLLLMCASCARAVPPENGGLIDRQRASHVITVAPDGTPVDPTSYGALGRKAFDEQIALITEGLDRSGKDKLIVFVHGGLNHRDASQRRVDELLPPLLAAGYYPLFLNWNSDLVDTAIEDLLYVRQGRVARYLGPVSSPFALLVAVGSGLLRAPLVWGQMLSSDLNATGIDALAFPGKRNAEALARELLDRGQPPDFQPVPLWRGREQIHGWDSAVSAGRYGVTLPTKLLLSPLIDGLGQGAWRNMLRRTQMLFHREDEFDVRDLRDRGALRSVLSHGPQGAAYKLFSGLRDHFVGRRQTETILVGHSMGAIVLNRALREFPDLRVGKIVYMAAACSIDDFRTSVVPYLKRSTETRFYSLMLHPAAEVGEWQKSLLDLTPRGSLLVWIDNFLAAPQTTLDRMLGSWENVMQTIHVIPPEVRPRTIFKAFCVGGPGCAGPTTHGGFSSAEFWKPTFWEIPAE
jgi:pimeloyl-ACP methyl ester carboxylesterase